MKNYFAIFLAVILVYGCNVNELEFDNLQQPELTGSYAAPLGDINYTVRELLHEASDSTLEFDEDSTGLITLVFNDTTEFDSGSDIINIEDILQNKTVSLGERDTVNNTNASIVVRDTIEILFEYPSDNQEPVDSMFYSSGTLTVSVTDDITPTTTYQLTIDNTVNVATQSAVVFTSTSAPSVDLAGYKTTLFRTDSSTNNFLAELVLETTLNPGQSTSSTDQIEVNIEYTDQQFSLLYGNFGEDTVQVGEEIIDIAFFEELGDEGFIFQSPIITMDFTNSFGLPLGLLFNNFYTVKEDSIGGNDTTRLSGSITNSPQVIGYPGLNEVGSSVQSTIQINSQNSTLPALLENAPGKIGVDLSARANPSDPTAQNFILANSDISVYTQIEIPLSIQLDELSREVDFDLGNGLDFEAADSVSIRVVAINEIPFYVFMDLELYNEGDTLLYSNYFNRVVETPFLNLDGSLKQPRKNIADIAISNAGVEAFKEASKMRVRLTFNTPESQNSQDIYVRLLADAKIDLTISAVVTLSPDFQ